MSRRTSQPGMSAILLVAVVLWSTAAPAQNLSLSGSTTVSVGTPVSVFAHVSPGTCTIFQINGNCVRQCPYPAGSLRLNGEMGPAVPATAAQNCAATAVLTFAFSSVIRPAGTHVFSADIVDGSGATVAISSNVVQVTWNKAASSTSSVSATPNPPVSGTPVTLSADVTGFAPSGRVDFKEGNTVIASATVTNSSNAMGSTTFQTAVSLNPGTHNLVASYAGDSNNLPSSSSAPLALTVTLSAAQAAAIQVIIESLLLND